MTKANTNTSKRLLHTPEGVRDLYGREYARKLQVEQKIHETIATYGFEDIQTPTFEFFDVFSREIGTTPSKELYKFFDKEGNTLVLRPDFTPSMARCAAKYFMEYQEPIRFSYMGNTFTNTSNLQGKLKEVTQMGAELINDASVEADAELISLVIECLRHAGLKRFQISIGQVEYFKGLCQEAGLDEETEYALRSCISGKNFFAAQELLEERGVGEPYRGVLLKVADMFVSMTSLSEARKLVQNERSLAAIDRLEQLYDVLKLYGVEEYVSFDLGMLSKYNYYTGVIFKAYTYGVGDAVVKGGRYDNLLHQFGKEAPAVGFMVVIDELAEALDCQKVEPAAQEPKIRLAYQKGDRADFQEKLFRAKELRAQGKSVELVTQEAESI
ncbi:MAG: ATP phosphoribosyltransferase regulatory subunit [Muribaculum sp.]|nr:ATP phosphoribosyltransferase regulatory subunit [Muribaculum sp.]